MIKNIKNIILYIISFLILGVSCIKNDLEEINNDLTFNQTYSLPIGSRKIVLDDFNYSDLSELSDTINTPIEYIFNYESILYNLPRTVSWHDSLNFDFNRLTDKYDSIKSIMFRVNIVNEIPAQLTIQLYSTKIDTIDNSSNSIAFFKNNPIKINPATYSNNGDIIPSEQYKNDTYFDKDFINWLADIENISIQIQFDRINTTNEIVRYLRSQSLEVQFALRFSFESTSNEI